MTEKKEIYLDKNYNKVDRDKAKYLVVTEYKDDELISERWGLVNNKL